MPKPNQHTKKPLESIDHTIQGPTLPYPNLMLHQLLEERARVSPEAWALEYGDQRITYRELQKSIFQTAHYLWAQGVRPGHVVAISLARSPDLIMTIFALLHCGATYVPLDNGYPDARLQLLIDDCKADFFISDASKSGLSVYSNKIFITDILTAIPTLPVESVTHEGKSDSAAYIIYTSGSTGTPKGVQVTHRNLINLVYSMGHEPGIGPEDKIFAVTTISFDAMVMETFLPLLHGATVVIVDEDTRRDGHLLLEKAREDDITMMWGTPSIWQILLDSGWNRPLNIKALIGGEPVPMTLAHKLLDRCTELWNIYGPTETTVCSLLTRIEKNDDQITVGRPVANTQIYLLDEKGAPVEEGEVGEIVIGGDGVSLGYLNRPELTEERFVENPFDADSHGKMYLSGDMGKLLPNGQLQCLGRRDKQVKVRGHRIELGEIESVVGKLSEVKKAVVLVTDQLGHELKLVAYLQAEGAKKDAGAIRAAIEEILPDFMVPSLFMWVDEFPITANGKIDVKSLPRPEYVRPDSAPLFKKPRTELEKTMAAIWTEQLKIPAIGIDDNFFEMGGTSLLTQRVATLVGQSLKQKIPITKIYQYPTIATLSEYIENESKTVSLPDYAKLNESVASNDVAIIGMAGRFPGAKTIAELWDVLREGKETISFFKPEELDRTIPESLRNDALYVKARGVLPSAKEFDALFFGINPKLAEAMDPQQRLFLEIAYEALEQSGHLPKHYDGSIGVYSGTGTNTYYKNNVLPNQDLLEQVGHLQANTVNEKDYIASRTAYHLNLKGPAVSVHSACSTSLLAIAEAVEAIRTGQCDVALAGGSSLTAPINSGHLYQEGSMLSPDGHCRSFDAEGKGTVFSDGAGVVLLKSLEAAEKDGDTIYGIIKGVGINNDGGNKGSFTAPSVEGQADAITRALNDARVSPSTISYLEAHGTATPLGDPIEMEGLHTAFGKQENRNYCAVGSIKSNMGHLTAAAGVAGLIKTVLAMYHRQIPPSLGFEKPNPAIDFENSPFFVNNTLRDWNVEGTRRAGISSFGVGGTNVHVVVEEYVSQPKNSGSARPMQLLAWSAKTENSAREYGTSLGNFLKEKTELSLADVAYSLNMTRDSFSHRNFISANSTDDAAEYLLSKKNSAKNTSVLKVVPNETVFLFPGQGAQFLQMGRALYEHEEIFKKAVDTCAALLMDDLGTDIRKILFPDANSKKAASKLKDTRYTQPALFVIEYALSQLWMHWGIKPTLLCGHSIGEFVAAHLAGIFSLEDTLHLIAVRGRLVSELPSGSMLSVRITAENVQEILPDTLSVAAVNSDRLCVVSGPDDEIGNFAKIIKEKDIPHSLLATSHAFHSAMMDPVLETFEKEVRQLTLNTPKIPIISTVTGKRLTEAEAINPEYWTDHLRATVCFSDAIDTILEIDDTVLLEVGPGQTLTTLTRQKKTGRTATVLTSLPAPKQEEGAYPALFKTLGELWLSGLEPDWKAFYELQSRQYVPLPSYAFDRRPCWVEPPMMKPTLQFAAPSKIPYEQGFEEPNVKINEDPTSTVMRKPIILQKISEIIENASGIELEAQEYDRSFLELGLDSLILTQIALTCKREFNMAITFRQLNEEFATPELLADHLNHHLPAEVYAPAPQSTSKQHRESMPMMQALPSNMNSAGNQNSALDLIAQQLQLLGQQIDLLKGQGAKQAPINLNGNSKNTNATLVLPQTEELSEKERTELKKPFGASPRIERQASELNEHQENFLNGLISSYNKKTGASKAYTQKHRSGMADPRVVSGFKPLTKELIYPIVIKKSSGTRLWDLDGNEYIDALNGFGSCLFGHQPDFIKKSLQKQIELGYEVGPQHPLAGEVCELLCEFTGHERAALCNTGSEAVLGSMRIARTVTGRSLIVAFSVSYHGIIDEVLVRGSSKLKTFPAAAGILSGSVQNMLILEYGTEESLNIIRERGHELAAVLVEPIQSRRPEFLPIDFLKQVREITTASETVLIFDEIITGFRMHAGGTQALFQIKADIATYGKVIGGGLPIGAIVGKKEYMDALDGGFWQYGDSSYPEVGVTYFAGTFVRHPLALAAAKASLNHLKEQGNALQDRLKKMTDRLATELNSEFLKRKLPMTITHYGSLWRLKFNEDMPYSELLFVLMREKGIHIWDGFPCFITTAYTEADVTQIIDVLLTCTDELIAAGFMDAKMINDNASGVTKTTSEVLNNPPMEGARLGQDENGNPAWFVAHPKKEGEYVKIDL